MLFISVSISLYLSRLFCARQISRSARRSRPWCCKASPPDSPCRAGAVPDSCHRPVLVGRNPLPVRVRHQTKVSTFMLQARSRDSGTPQLAVGSFHTVARVISISAILHTCAVYYTQVSQPPNHINLICERCYMLWWGRASPARGGRLNHQAHRLAIANKWVILYPISIFQSSSEQS